MFGRIARVYDLMNRVMTLGLDGRWRAFAARQIALGPGQRALDIGTGTGDLAIAVARASAPTARVVGIDFTPEMLAIGRAKVARLGLANRIDFVQGDGERLPFESDTFDACTSAFVVRNLADLHQGLAEMLRVLRPGGHMVCLEMSHPYNPAFAAAFHLYFDRVVPLLGKLIGKALDAYSYLPTSVTSFPTAPQFARLLEATGWEQVRYYYRVGGVVAVHVARKRAE
jgi:demethylmenaquinone methyltransferase/2-methoxy-6-polyprenyl-1,4-benzoquinol methylase